MIIDETTKDIIIRIFNMYLEGKSYQTIANILNMEQIPTLTKSKWKDATIEKIINNKIYMGDYERYKRIGKQTGQEPVVYMNVVEPIITRAMFEDVQAQKKKNQRAFCRDRVYLFMQKDKVEETIMPIIMDLIEYDMTVKNYFYPVLADKKETNTKKLDKEISLLENKKNRIKEAYLQGIVEVGDFSNDYKVIEEKLNILEQKRLEIIDENKQTFSPQALMADRDVAKEKLIRSNQFKSMLMAEWERKTKEEKQEFISKFIESITLVKDKKGYFDLVNLKFRSSYLEQIFKLMENGMFDVEIPFEKGKEIYPITSTVMMDTKELKEYMDKLSNYYEVSYYELKRLDEPKKGYQKKYFTIDLVNDNGEKFFKLVELVCDDKRFPTQKTNRIVGEIRVKEKEKVS